MRYTGYILIPIVALCVAACGKTTEKADGTNEASGYEEVAEEPTGDPALAEYIVIAKESMSLRLYDSNNALICRFNVATGKHAGLNQRYMQRMYLRMDRSYLRLTMRLQSMELSNLYLH